MAENTLQLQTGRILRIRTPPLTEDFIASMMKQTIQAALETPESISSLTEEEVWEAYSHIRTANSIYWANHVQQLLTEAAGGIQLYSDEALTEPLKFVNLGTTWCWETKKRTCWIVNRTKAFLRDIVVKAGEGVSVEAPSTLKINEKQPITFTWKPKGFEDLKGDVTIEGFKIFDVSRIEVYDG